MLSRHTCFRGRSVHSSPTFRKENSLMNMTNNREVGEAFTPSTLVRASLNHVACAVDSDAVILDFDSGTYFGLNPVANRIWQLAQQPIAVADILTTLIGEYEVEAARCERDLLNLLEELSMHKLIVVTEARLDSRVSR